MTSQDLVTVDREESLVLAARETALIQVVLDSVDSDHTKRAYRRALLDFLHRHAQQGRPALNKATVQRYAAELRSAGMSAARINQRLTAIRKLAREAADNGTLPEALANGIKAVRGVRGEGQRAGNWLTREQSQALLDTPNVSTLRGKRDRAILALLIGCGLRRSEAASLTFAHVQQREGRWVIVALVGKRNKARFIPMPSWAKAAIEDWTAAAGIHEGRIFRAVNKGGYVTGETMSDQGIADVARHYAKAAGLPGLAAHDLRRTFAKLAYKGCSGLDQSQLSLGHASIKTTERYLGVAQDLTDAPCDRLRLRLGD
jgi:site-specific recombinase XerD